MNKRTSTIMVSVIDLEPFKQHTRQTWEKDPKNAGKTAGTVYLPKLGYVKTKKGTFIIENEGVISAKPLEKGGSYTFGVSVAVVSKEDGIRTTDGVCETIPIFPDYEVEINKNTMVHFIKGGEPQENLATFIRTFGARLESNFNGAQEHLIKNGAK